MKWITCEQGALAIRKTSADVDPAHSDRSSMYFADIPIASGAVHEFLFDQQSGRLPPPLVPPLLCAKRMLTERKGSPALVWFDPAHTLYPPAIWAAGIPPHQVYILRPKPADLVWAVAECLRCSGVSVVIATLPARLSRPEVRRLQLAAEHSGGAGLLLRTQGKGDDIYAAATRWRVAPASGDQTTQRWNMTFLHGQGRHIGQTYLLECRRAATADYTVKPFSLPVPATLADHPALAPPSRRRA